MSVPASKQVTGGIRCPGVADPSRPTYGRSGWNEKPRSRTFGGKNSHLRAG
jgi:hypothetical protein